MASSVDIPTFPTSNTDDLDTIHPLAGEDLWSRLGATWLPNGVFFDYGNTFVSYGDSTGMVVKVKSGLAVIDGFAAKSDTEIPLDISAAHPTSDRIDRIVLRLTTTSPATITLKVIAGTAALDPDPPALLDDSTHTDIALARVAVGAGVSTITADDITTERSWTGITRWLDYSPTPFASSGLAPVLSTITDPQIARFRFVGNEVQVYWRGLVAISSSSGSAGASYGVPLPIGALYNMVVGVASVQNSVGHALSLDTGTSGAPFPGGVQLLKYDHGNLLRDDVYRFDSFTASYEPTPS